METAWPPVDGVFVFQGLLVIVTVEKGKFKVSEWEKERDTEREREKLMDWERDCVRKPPHTSPLHDCHCISFVVDFFFLSFWHPPTYLLTSPYLCFVSPISLSLSLYLHLPFSQSFLSLFYLPFSILSRFLLKSLSSLSVSFYIFISVFPLYTYHASHTSFSFPPLPLFLIYLSIPTYDVFLSLSLSLNPSLSLSFSHTL